MPRAWPCPTAVVPAVVTPASCNARPASRRTRSPRRWIPNVMRRVGVWPASAGWPVIWPLRCSIRSSMACLPPCRAVTGWPVRSCSCACNRRDRCVMPLVSICCSGSTAWRVRTRSPACRARIQLSSSTSTVASRVRSLTRCAGSGSAAGWRLASGMAVRCTTIRSGFASRYCCWLPAPVWHRSGRYCARLCARATRRRSASSP